MDEIVNLINNKNYNEALKALNSLLSKEPNNVEFIKQRGKVKHELRDLKGALDDFNKADKVQPNNAFTLRYRGATKRKLGDYKEALKDLNSADKIEPNNAFTLKNRGDAKRMLNDTKGALDDLTRADKIEPNDLFTLQTRGDIKRMLNNYKGALEDFNRADEIEPNNAFTLDSRSIVLYHLGDFVKALEDITQLLKLEPNNKRLLQGKIDMEQKIKKYNLVPQTKQSQAVHTKLSEVQTSTVVTPVIQEGVIQVPFSELTVIKTLGEGGFGEVLLAEWRGIKVALKKIKSTVIADDVAHEAKSLMLFRYKFIVTMMGITTDPVTKNTILIMEYMKHGSLEDLLFKHNVTLKRSEVIRLALDIAQGVNYLHSQRPKVLHRDLKSANVLLHRDKRRGKLADFGTAKFLHKDAQAKTVIGAITIAMPPEMIAEEVYDEKVDVFAFGVIVYEMLTNKRLPQLEDIYRQKRIRENVTDAELRDLVLECCASDPTKRPQMRDIVALLRKMKDEAK